MREMSRVHIAEIWRRGGKGETLNSEDAAFFKAMQDHPEYTDFWEHAAELGGREVEADRTNPFLHVSLHAVIERQIAEGNPPETSQALFRLTRAGMDRHEALHRIASVLSEMLWQTLRDRKHADPETFRRRLRQLKP
jgi:hypothetical protein